FKPAHVDGKEHQIDVKVKGKGLQVHARRSYLAAPAVAPAVDNSPASTKGPTAASAAALRSALAPVLPRRDLSVDIAAAPFASAGAMGSEVLVTLAVDQGSD